MDRTIQNTGQLKKEIVLLIPFIRAPSKYISTSKIRCVTFRDDERVDILDKKEVDKGIIGNIEYASNYLKEHTDVRFEIKGIQRIEHPEYPQEAYREAIVNAIIHRDYFESGEVAVEKLKSGIIINNPGGLIPSLPKEEFGKLSRPRNRLLADMLSKTTFMEKVGTGIRRIKTDCKENNNPVELNFDQYNFFVNIGSNEKYPQNLNKTQIEILALIEQNNNMTKAEMAQKLDLSIEAVKKNMRVLRKKNIILFIGPSKGGYWKIKGK